MNRAVVWKSEQQHTRRRVVAIFFDCLSIVHHFAHVINADSTLHHAFLNVSGENDFHVPTDRRESLDCLAQSGEKFIVDAAEAAVGHDGDGIVGAQNFNETAHDVVNFGNHFGGLSLCGDVADESRGVE